MKNRQKQKVKRAMAVKKTKKKKVKVQEKGKKPASKTGIKARKEKNVFSKKPAVGVVKVRSKPSRKKTASKSRTRTTLASRRARETKSEEERRAFLRRALVRKREEIVKEAKEEISKYIKGETRQLVDTALDDGDWSVVDLSEDISLKQLSTHRENLQKIDESLRKLNEGTYGICEDCGEEISEERLKVLPFAIYCVDCQEKRERLEEMERKERLV
ncbi:MAG: TraR/DksA C4-type zinc finger protein [Nitrospirota bacterium]